MSANSQPIKSINSHDLLKKEVKQVKPIKKTEDDYINSVVLLEKSLIFRVLFKSTMDVFEKEVSKVKESKDSSYTSKNNNNLYLCRNTSSSNDLEEEDYYEIAYSTYKMTKSLKMSASVIIVGFMLIDRLISINTELLKFKYLKK